MAHALEARSPFLDHELMELAASIPADLKIRGSQKKWILREAMRGWLPDDILDRPKQGFSVPESDWLRTDLAGYAREVLLDRSSLDRGYFEPKRRPLPHRSSRRRGRRRGASRLGPARARALAARVRRPRAGARGPRRLSRIARQRRGRPAHARPKTSNSSWCSAAARSRRWGGVPAVAKPSMPRAQSNTRCSKSSRSVAASSRDAEGVGEGQPVEPEALAQQSRGLHDLRLDRGGVQARAIRVRVRVVANAVAAVDPLAQALPAQVGAVLGQEVAERRHRTRLPQRVGELALGVERPAGAGSPQPARVGERLDLEVAPQSRCSRAGTPRRRAAPRIALSLLRHIRSALPTQEVMTKVVALTPWRSSTSRAPHPIRSKPSSKVIASSGRPERGGLGPRRRRAGRTRTSARGGRDRDRGARASSPSRSRRSRAWAADVVVVDDVDPVGEGRARAPAQGWRGRDAADRALGDRSRAHESCSRPARTSLIRRRASSSLSASQ